MDTLARPALVQEAEWGLQWAPTGPAAVENWRIAAPKDLALACSCHRQMLLCPCLAGASVPLSCHSASNRVRAMLAGPGAGDCTHPPCLRNVCIPQGGSSGESRIAHLDVSVPRSTSQRQGLGSLVLGAPVYLVSHPTPTTSWTTGTAGRKRLHRPSLRHCWTGGPQANTASRLRTASNPDPTS